MHVIRMLRSHGRSWLVCLLLGTFPAAFALAEVAVPTLTGAPAGKPYLASGLDLSKVGYVEQEFFMSGTAQAYVASGALGNDGKWSAQENPGVTAQYTTRILVRRPVHPARFNGTVVVEWLNVSGGFELAPDWSYMRAEMLRAGYAWVGVSAQFIGVTTLQQLNAARYATLFHPGDSWSYDIYSQAGAVLRHPAANGPRPLGNLTPRVRTVLAIGESQSGSRMFTYYNAIQPLAQVYDGLMIHSIGGGSALSQSTAGGALGAPAIPPPPGVPATPDIVPPPTAFIRTDLAQPVLFLNTETDVTLLGAAFSVHNQPDSRSFRMWEVTGTAHGDVFHIAALAEDTAGAPGEFPDCGNPPINDGPHRFAVRAAVHALNAWVRHRVAPPIAPRFETAIVAGPQGPRATLVRDPDTGLARGGIRLPPVRVPVATLTGERSPGAHFSCFLWGGTDPWNGDSDLWDGQVGVDPSPTPEPLLPTLYRSRGDYLLRYVLATEAAIRTGFVRPGDRGELYEIALEADVP